MSENRFILEIEPYVLEKECQTSDEAKEEAYKKVEEEGYTHAGAIMIRPDGTRQVLAVRAKGLVLPDYD